LRKNRADARVLAILRLGLAQILFFDRLADYAVVSRTVDLAAIKAPGLKGLVNAVLRGFLRDRDSIWGWPREIDGREVDPLIRLATFYSHPLWLVERLVGQLGFREARALLVANNQPASPTLRVNPRRVDRAELARLLPFPTRETEFSPWGLVPEAWAGPPTAWPGYATGLFAIQDEASQILGLLAGEARNILDCCAGLGGKSLALAAAGFPEIRVLALDPHEGRLVKLEKEAERLGLAENLEISPGAIQSYRTTATFDLALVDAHCSGLGIIRRRPDIKWRKSPEDIPRLADLQLELLLAAAPRVAPGGRLIYSICSTTEEEGPGVVQRFLAKAPDFRVLGPTEIPPGLRALYHGPGQLRLWPHREKTDGFFYGLLAKV
jgi:16S rRNA (cytosine967-C5)-methyltransferase